MKSLFLVVISVVIIYFAAENEVQAAQVPCRRALTPHRCRRNQHEDNRNPGNDENKKKAAQIKDMVKEKLIALIKEGKGNQAENQGNQVTNQGNQAINQGWF